MGYDVSYGYPSVCNSVWFESGLEKLTMDEQL